MHAHTCLCMRAYIYAHTCSFVRACVRAHIRACARARCLRKCACVPVPVLACVRACVHLRAHVCACVCVRLCVHACVRASMCIYPNVLAVRESAIYENYTAREYDRQGATGLISLSKQGTTTSTLGVRQVVRVRACMCALTCRHAGAAQCNALQCGAV